MLDRTEGRFVPAGPRDLVAELIEAAPGGDRKAMFKAFRAKIRGNEDFQRAVDWYFFINMHDDLTTIAKAMRETRPKARDTVQVQEVKRRLVEVVLMNLTLPNGKRLARATFADCAVAGGWFARIAEHGEPDQIVGKVLSEGDLRQLLPGNFGQS